MRRCVSFDRGCRTHDQFHDKTMGFAVLLAIMTCLYSASAGGQLLHSTLLAGAPAALLRVDANVAVQKVALRKHLWMVVLCRAACVRALCGHRIKRVRPVADMAGAVCLRAGSCWASGTGPSCFPCRLWSVPLAPCLSVCTRAFVCMCALASRVDCGPCLCLPVSLSITGFEKLSASGSSRCLSVCLWLLSLSLCVHALQVRSQTRAHTQAENNLNYIMSPPPKGPLLSLGPYYRSVQTLGTLPMVMVPGLLFPGLVAGVKRLLSRTRMSLLYAQKQKSTAEPGARLTRRRAAESRGSRAGTGTRRAEVLGDGPVTRGAGARTRSPAPSRPRP